MRLGRGAVLGGLAAAALGGCGGGSRHARPATATSSTHPVAHPAAKLATALVSPARIRLELALDTALHSAGSGSGAVVYDISSRQTLFSLRGGVMRPPASVEKLYTSVAVLTDLGPGAQLQTTVLGSGHLGRGGIWHGNLYLRGGGDPSFGDGTFNQVWEEGYGPTAQQLAAQIRQAGIRRVSGRVIGDESLFDSRRGGPSSGFAPDVPDIGGQLSALTYDHGSTRGRLGPAAFAARELALTLRAGGVKVRAATFTGVTPAGAHQLGSVSSPPVSVLLKLTDIPSDDFFAEMLTKQLGVRFGASGSTAAGASVIAGVLARYGLSPTIVDGSGLSREDRTSPGQVVALLRSLWGTPNGVLLLGALPVVGVNGTVRRLAPRTPAHGRCEAKTGTLNYVTNLSGYCHSLGGDQLAFAVFLDGPRNDRATVLLGRMVAAIARY